jgi:hypothetical protein
MRFILAEGMSPRPRGSVNRMIDRNVYDRSASASYLKEQVLPKLEEGQSGIYVIGQAGLEEELREVGLSWTGGSGTLFLSL